jgi:hypothetical protein
MPQSERLPVFAPVDADKADARYRLWAAWHANLEDAFFHEDGALFAWAEKQYAALAAIDDQQEKWDANRRIGQDIQYRQYMLKCVRDVVDHVLYELAALAVTGQASPVVDRQIVFTALSLTAKIGRNDCQEQDIQDFCSQLLVFPTVVDMALELIGRSLSKMFDPKFNTERYELSAADIEKQNAKLLYVYDRLTMVINRLAWCPDGYMPSLRQRMTVSAGRVYAEYPPARFPIDPPSPDPTP